mmetsp:Transcript_47872/g.79319  ORF Transcript_47872/g.79319 Transcript_47872/m.79319 type:complete len:143 (+) Transcript_47872:340-768(+)|eukprot:jgi/Bigna1/60423/fgenesh1_kg.11_\
MRRRPARFKPSFWKTVHQSSTKKVPKCYRCCFESSSRRLQVERSRDLSKQAVSTRGDIFSDMAEIIYDNWRDKLHAVVTRPLLRRNPTSKSQNKPPPSSFLCVNNRAQSKRSKRWPLRTYKGKLPVPTAKSYFNICHNSAKN